ncbi:MAG TPA: DNA/RNA nuclease SfsA [Thermoprotei archaeon]|nr:DNA/RNA nuclease SfsA [Thermoprotei archaeon]
MPIIKLYSGKLYKIKVIERLNRFVVKVELEGKTVLCHNTNTGRLHEYLSPGMDGLAVSIDGGRLRYRLIGIFDKYGYALIDTYSQVKVFEKLVDMDLIPWLNGYRILSRHPKILNSKLDYLLGSGDEELYVEVKSAVLRNGNAASYPDCPTERGQRHIKDIIELFRNGYNVMIIFIAALPRVECFTPYREGDPIVYDLIYEARGLGIPIKSIALYLNSDGNVDVYNVDLPFCDSVG